MDRLLAASAIILKGPSFFLSSFSFLISNFLFPAFFTCYDINKSKIFYIYLIFLFFYL